ncbi:MAG: glycogen debranching protein GlgX [Planctomycetes bacterium]|nr:glycogen debranching protein GlgX [Planctomycetota bacterium]
MKALPGRPYPLGATFDGSGTNVSLYSEVAQRVELCLFDDQGVQTCVDLPERTNFCWHAYLPEVTPVQRYGFRVHGPWQPEKGHRCCPGKLLLDPYAKAIDGDPQWNEALFAHWLNNPDGPLNDSDSGPYAPRAVVVNPFFDWNHVHRPHVPLYDTIIYETHVRGFSLRHGEIPQELRGTYEGLSHPAAIEHFQSLGITTLELMPVHRHITPKHLADRGLRNYWGYDTIGYFAPHPYVRPGEPGAEVRQFKNMVKYLHLAGIEVIIDVVYNHTAEGNRRGPVLAFRGIDNAAYYHLDERDPRRYVDFSGTGNTLNTSHPVVLQLIMDSLRYWVTEMHVDGFRFDLAPALARELHEVDRLSSFFDIIHQDPILSQVKLIAEPWDVGEGGYQVGRFPPLWSEWNDRYRDTVRRFWHGFQPVDRELIQRLQGSPDLYEGTGRRPHASVNFVTAHDGFTLRDLVSYDRKHNEANREDNRDGLDQNYSCNFGAEGPSDDPALEAIRLRQQCSFLGTLMLSLGIPMLLGGDEIGRTQGGNNNAYCQDNELSWYDWDHANPTLLAFAARLVHLRRTHPVFRRWRWFEDRPAGDGRPHRAWYAPDGHELADEDLDGNLRAIGLFLSGEVGLVNERGQTIQDDDFLLLMNAATDVRMFTLAAVLGDDWRVVVDSARPEAEDLDAEPVPNGQPVAVQSHGLVVLSRER